MNKPLWQPSKERISDTNLIKFMEKVKDQWVVALDDYDTLHSWSVAEPEKFWQTLWDFGEVIGKWPGGKVFQHRKDMPGADWFPGSQLNFAENLLRRRDDAPAIVFKGETNINRVISFADLYALVSQLVKAMERAGVGQGDRVAGFLPNLPEAIAAMLATAALGAIWSSCSPDFGAQGVLDRFGQIRPKLVFSVDRYYYNGKSIDCRPVISEVLKNLPSARNIVLIPYDSETPQLENAFEGVALSDFISPFKKGEINFKRLPFAHPLYILFSSGTTGVPKCIVHGAGGTLLQHLKEHYLQADVKPGDKIFYFTTLGWMMWNWLVSGLACGATVLLYDGSPFYPDGNTLFDFAEKTKMTHFGTSAKFIDALKNSNAKPARTHNLFHLRTMMSTGSPLVPESYDFVYKNVKRDICLSSISGGTDIVGCFVAGNPIGAVWRGEIQAPCLGMDVVVFNQEGVPVTEEKGELVCRNVFPSMPVAFWNDDKGLQYKAAYFERFPGIWCHGDWAEITGNGGIVIYGRSDATLNPGGVRIGTAEIYRQVEKLDFVEEAIAIGQEWNGDVRIVLFVRLTEGKVLDQVLTKGIENSIRSNASPRHVPARILQTIDIPRTKSGKITELAVRAVIHGYAVRNTEALANPEALEHFRDRIELKS